MTNKLKTLVAACGALLFTAVPAIANAERIYFLVGTRHVYWIGPNRDQHLSERQQIEQDYADRVAGDQATFQKAVADGANPDSESVPLNDDLDKAARERDERLGEIFERRDDIRARHPELQIQGDGPYQVMGINFHMYRDDYVFENFVVYEPWPGYVVVDRPYGWVFGVVYDPFAFHHVYVSWYGGYVIAGRPAFCGFVGHFGPVYAAFGLGAGGHIHPVAFSRGVYRPVSIHSSGAWGRPNVAYARARSYGSFAPRGVAPRGGSFRGGSFVGKSFGGSRAGSTPSKYGRPGGSFGSRPDSSRSTSGYGHSSTGSFGSHTTPGRSGPGSTRPSGSFGSRTEPSHTSRPTSSYGRSSGSSFGSSRSTSSYGRSTSGGTGRSTSSYGRSSSGSFGSSRPSSSSSSSSTRSYGGSRSSSGSRDDKSKKGGH